jgi:Sulfotransferase family
MNVTNLINQSPIVVFGTGGSGTRVITEVLREAGCFVGYNLNNPLDNQDFGFLLSGRVDWMVKHFPFHDDIALPYLKLFRKVFFYQSLNWQEILLLFNVMTDYIDGRSRRSFRRRPLLERLIRGRRLLKAILPGTSLDMKHCYQKWGFKSPEAIYFLLPIVKFFKNVKLIHLVRDGRDMIFSKNRSRLQYLEMFQDKYDDTFKSQLSHWGAINSWALEQGKKILNKDQYLLIRYEDICKFPQNAVDKVLSFSGLQCENVEYLYTIPQPNPAINRWKEHKDLLRDIDHTDLKKFRYYND